jgi:transcriptional antiterminator NusG
MKTEENMKWYIISVLNSKETQIKEKIEDNLIAENQMKHVSQILAPKEKYFQIRQGKKIKAERNYFPGYIFIECVMNGELIRSVEKVSGVKSFLKGNNGPIPMSNREVKNLLAKVEKVSITDNVSISQIYKIGAGIKVLDGPFASFIGNITEVNDDKKSIKVNIMVFNRPTPIELDISQVVLEN